MKYILYNLMVEQSGIEPESETVRFGFKFRRNLSLPLIYFE